jgi:hypothetical protein
MRGAPLALKDALHLNQGREFRMSNFLAAPSKADQPSYSISWMRLVSQELSFVTVVVSFALSLVRCLRHRPARYQLLHRVSLGLP